MPARFNLDGVLHLCVKSFMDGKIGIGIQSVAMHQQRWTVFEMCKKPATRIPDGIHHVFASRYLCNNDDEYPYGFEHPLAKAHKIIFIFENTS